MKLEIGRAGWYAIYSPFYILQTVCPIKKRWLLYSTTPICPHLGNLIIVIICNIHTIRPHTYFFSISKYLLQCIRASDSILTVIESEYIYKLIIE